MSIIFRRDCTVQCLRIQTATFKNIGDDLLTKLVSQMYPKMTESKTPVLVPAVPDILSIPLPPVRCRFQERVRIIHSQLDPELQGTSLQLLRNLRKIVW